MPVKTETTTIATITRIVVLIVLFLLVQTIFFISARQSEKNLPILLKKPTFSVFLFLPDFATAITLSPYAGCDDGRSGSTCSTQVCLGRFSCSY